MKVIFLDIDGVLNGHSYDDEAKSCNIRRECVKCLNEIVKATGAKIVISSAWRYMVHGGAMTLTGFSYMLRTHGLLCVADKLIIDVTRKDAEEDGAPIPDDRPNQIAEWLDAHPEVTHHLVLDDEDYGFARHQLNFLRTDWATGLTDADVTMAVVMLTSDGWIGRKRRHYPERNAQP